MQIPEIFSKSVLVGSIATGLAALTLAGCQTTQNQIPEKPNIIIILADDMGYSDIGCYGGEIPTPNINRLGENGIRFTQFYNGARCCPTRASLLTGLYAHQAGVGSMVSPNDDRPGYMGRLNESSITLAEALKPQGYQTFMSGKWHVTHYDYANPEPTLHRETWPRQRGFDRFFGTLSGAGSFFDPVSLMEDNEFIEPWDDFYYTDAITGKAVQYIEEADQNKPFLLYLAHTAPHWPMHAREEHIDMFKGKYMMGWDELREQRYEKMLQMGLIDEKWPLSPRDESNQSWADAENKEWEDHRMAVYAAMMYSMDQGIGKVMETLEQKGELDNTLILFLSDNGACAEVINGTKTRHGFFENGGTRSDILPGGPETYAAYGQAWANAGNTPFRFYKKWTHEGGIATPFIAHWPAVIKKGQITDHMAHIIDIMPTLLDLAGGTYPETFNQKSITPAEGLSLTPLFTGDLSSQQNHEILYWEHLGHKAIRKGDWKLVAEADQPWELYNMVDDRNELNDLAVQNPEKVKELETLWEEWAVRALVK